MPKLRYGKQNDDIGIPEGSQQNESPQTTLHPVDRFLSGDKPLNKPDVGIKPSTGGEGTVIDVPDDIGSISPKSLNRITEDDIHEAIATLQRYKSGKSALEQRVIADELFWELRQWEAIGAPGEREKSSNPVRSTSAWLFNSIISKHADAMDNYPEPIVLPRERSDERTAEILKDVLPVVLKYNNYQKQYRNAWWDKLVHGTGIYAVTWDSRKDNGLGDISIETVDITKIFWEPGISNIQKSRNVFVAELVDTDLLKDMYPEQADRITGGDSLTVAKYLYQDNIDTEDKSVVIDWYYKLTKPDGRQVLHYVKFVGNTILYASENDEQLAERGFYDHGKYPFVFDSLYPMKGTPAGFGLVSVCRDPQIYIDSLSSNILQHSLMGTRKRFFVSRSSAVNADDFADWNKPFVAVEGELGEERIKEINVEPIAPAYINVLQMKIDELKETSSNRDVNNGSSASGVTAASAIAALQEAGSKISRDMINMSYDAFEDICHICIEIMSQFYTENRTFRITGKKKDEFEYQNVNAQMIGNQPIVNPLNGVPMTSADGSMLFRKPIFDITVQAQKRNPFSTMEANQRAQELYSMGFFNPEKAQESLCALEMMEFEGKDKVLDQVKTGQTLMQVNQQLMQTVQQLTSVLGGVTGMQMPAFDGNMPDGAKVGNGMQAPRREGGGARTTNSAGVPMTSYGQRLAARSKPNMNNKSDAANPANNK